MHINIGKHSLKNRMVFPAIRTNYANTDGTVSDKLLDFYTVTADGGCGMIFTGTAVISSDSVAKSAAGQEDDVNRCIQYNMCAFWASGDPYMCCSVNPALA